VYINIAEHPARMERDTRVALEVWMASYARATWLQAPLAILAFLAGCLAWWLGGGASWLLGGILIGAVVPFTLLVIMPTNKALFAQGRVATSTTRVLLERWGHLHAVRSVLSLGALVLLTWKLTA
jgi:hypothetical protein